jgi:xylulokinase
LLGTGTPWLDPDARGVIAGLTRNTTFEGFARSGLEGVTYEMRWNLDLLEAAGLPVTVIHAVGGGSRSRTWLQMKADIFGREVVAIDGEASCSGAAICAAIGSGVYSCWEEASNAFVRVAETFAPRAAVHSQYQSVFEQYKELANRVYGFRSSRIENEDPDEERSD